MSISVIIPTYNSGKLLVEAIESVLAQTLEPQEIVVVDDGSTDDTLERLAPYRGMVRYIHQVNAGVSAARNRGIEESLGEFVAFLDADDVWHPLKLAKQLAAFERNPDLGLLGTRVFDWPSRRYQDVITETPGTVTPVIWRQLTVKNHFTTSSIVARRRPLLSAGPFDTGLQGPEDRDLWLRVAERTRVGNLEIALTGYRSVAGSVSKQSARCREGMLRILRKLDQRGAWNGDWRLRAKAYSYVYHSAAYLYHCEGYNINALQDCVRSLVVFPFPYQRSEVKTSFERPKRMINILLRSLGLREPGRSS